MACSQAHACPGSRCTRSSVRRWLPRTGSRWAPCRVCARRGGWRRTRLRMEAGRAHGRGRESRRCPSRMRRRGCAGRAQAGLQCHRRRGSSPPQKKDGTRKMRIGALDGNACHVGESVRCGEEEGACRARDWNEAAARTAGPLSIASEGSEDEAAVVLKVEAGVAGIVGEAPHHVEDVGCIVEQHMSAENMSLKLEWRR